MWNQIVTETHQTSRLKSGGQSETPARQSWRTCDFDNAFCDNKLRLARYFPDTRREVAHGARTGKRAECEKNWVSLGEGEGDTQHTWANKILLFNKYLCIFRLISKQINNNKFKLNKIRIDWNRKKCQAGAELGQAQGKLRLVGLWLDLCLLWLTNMV